MSEEHDTSESSYRPSSPDLSGLTNSNPSINSHAPPPRLTRIPSYHAPDPSLPPGYSFSPRGSYDASPFFSPSTNAPSTSYFGSRPHPQPHLAQQSPYSPPAFRTPSLPGQTPIQHSPPGQSRPLGLPSYHNTPPPQYPPSPFRPPYNQQLNQAPFPHSPVPLTPYGEMPRTRRQQAADTQQDPDYLINPSPRQAAQPKLEQPLAVQPVMPAPPTDPTAGIDVKTKFPVARIKRIMQADEDVGKVAQATPTAVAKALELFMIALVSKGANEAKANNSKRVTAQHLKTALMNDGQFDFLSEICENIPDEGTKKSRAKSEAKSEDSDEDTKPKGKGKGGRRRKAGTDDDSD